MGPHMSDSVICVYVTAPDNEVAQKIAHAVIDEGLAACVNVFDGATSFFRWNGQTNVAKESILFMKTNQSRIQELTTRVSEIHPYDCPCVVSWTIDQGWPPFLDWVREQTHILCEEEENK